MEKQIGSYTITYTPEELIGVPDHVFIDSKTDKPVVNQPEFLSQVDTNFLYTNALRNYNRRQFATVHDYSGGVSSSRIDTEGRYTHYIPVSDDVYQFLDKKLSEDIFPLIRQNYDTKGLTLQRTEGWQFLGYGDGYFFVNHCDNCVPSSYSTNPEDRKYIWWNNTPSRKFTVLLYLNDQCDDYSYTGTYSGGDLTLNRIIENGEVYRVKPKAGTLVAFPSNFFYSHEVHRITHGYRFCIVTWLDLV